MSGFIERQDAYNERTSSDMGEIKDLVKTHIKKTETWRGEAKQIREEREVAIKQQREELEARKEEAEAHKEEAEAKRKEATAKTAALELELLKEKNNLERDKIKARKQIAVAIVGATVSIITTVGGAIWGVSYMKPDEGKIVHDIIEQIEQIEESPEAPP